MNSTDPATAAVAALYFMLAERRLNDTLAYAAFITAVEHPSEEDAPAHDAPTVAPGKHSTTMPAHGPTTVPAIIEFDVQPGELYPSPAPRVAIMPVGIEHDEVA